MDLAMQMMNSFMSLNLSKETDVKLSKYKIIKDTMNADTLGRMQVPLLIDILKQDLVYTKSAEFFQCARSTWNHIIKVFEKNVSICKHLRMFLTKFEMGDTTLIVYNILVMSLIMRTENEDTLYESIDTRVDKTQLLNALQINIKNVPLETVYKFVHFRIIPQIFYPDTSIDMKFQLVDFVLDLPMGFAYQFMSPDVAKKFKTDVIERYLPSFDPNKHQIVDWWKFCKMLIHYCGKILHSEILLTNSILRFVEVGFKNKHIPDRCGSYNCWKTLILNYNLDKMYLRNPKQYKLLEKPLKAKLSRNNMVAEKRFEAYACFMEVMGNCAAPCVQEFLNFCFGPFNTEGILAESGNCHSLGRTVKEIFPKSLEILLKLLGHQVENCCVSKYVYITDIYKIVPLHSHLITNTFLEEFVGSIRICSEFTKQWMQETDRATVISCLWGSLFSITKIILCDRTKTSIYQEIVKNINTIVTDCIVDQSYRDVLNIILKSIVTYVYKIGYSQGLYDDLMFPIIKVIVLYQSNCKNAGKLEMENLLDYSSKSPKFIRDINDLFKNTITCRSQVAVDIIRCTLNSIPPHANGTIIVDDIKEDVYNLLYWSLRNATNDCESIWKLGMDKKVFNTYPELLTDLTKAMRSHLKEHPTSVTIVLNLCLCLSPLLTILEQSLFKELVYTAVMCYGLHESDNRNIKASIKLLRILIDTKRKHNFENLSHFYMGFEEMLKMKAYEVLPILKDYIASLTTTQKLGFTKSLLNMVSDLTKDSNQFSKSAQEILDILNVPKPINVVKTPTTISRGAKIRNMAKISPFPNPIESSKSNLLQLFDENTKSPIRLFNKFMGKEQNSPKASNKIPIFSNKRENLNDIDIDSFAKIDTKVIVDPDKLNAHQKEVAGRRSTDIPALYEDLTQSSMDFLNLRQNLAPSVSKSKNILTKEINNRLITTSSENGAANVDAGDGNTEKSDVNPGIENKILSPKQLRSRLKKKTAENNTKENEQSIAKTSSKLVTTECYSASTMKKNVAADGPSLQNLKANVPKDGLDNKFASDNKLLSDKRPRGRPPADNTKKRDQETKTATTTKNTSLAQRQDVKNCIEKGVADKLKEGDQETKKTTITKNISHTNTEQNSKILDHPVLNGTEDSNVFIETFTTTCDVKEHKVKQENENTPEKNKAIHANYMKDDESISVKTSPDDSPPTNGDAEHDKSKTHTSTSCVLQDVNNSNGDASQNNDDALDSHKNNKPNGAQRKSRSLNQLKMDIVGAEEYLQSLGRRTIKRKTWDKDEVVSATRRNRKQIDDSEKTPKRTQNSSNSPSKTQKKSKTPQENPPIQVENIVQEKPPIATSTDNSCDIIEDTQEQISSCTILPTTQMTLITAPPEFLADTPVLVSTLRNLNQRARDAKEMTDTETLEVCSVTDGNDTDMKVSEMDTDTINITADSLPVETVAELQNKPISEVFMGTLSCSPVTNETPIKTTELLNNTFDISPIKLVDVMAEEGTSAEDIFKRDKDDNMLILTDSDKPTDLKSEEELVSLKGPSNRSVKLLNLLPEVLPVKTRNIAELPVYVSSPKTDRVKKMMLNCEEIDKVECTSLLDDEFLFIENKNILMFGREVPSPLATPKISILKRKLPDSAEGISPCAKRKRVNFSDPPITCEKIYFKEQEEKSHFKKPKRSPKSVLSHKTNEATKNEDINIINPGEMIDLIEDGVIPLQASPPKDETLSESAAMGAAENEPNTTMNEDDTGSRINVISNILIMETPQSTIENASQSSSKGNPAKFSQTELSYSKRVLFEETPPNDTPATIHFQDSCLTMFKNIINTLKDGLTKEQFNKLITDLYKEHVEERE